MIDCYYLLPCITIFAKLNSFSLKRIYHQLQIGLFIYFSISVSRCPRSIIDKQIVNLFENIFFVLLKPVEVGSLDGRPKARDTQSTPFHCDKIIILLK